MDPTLPSDATHSDHYAPHPQLRTEIPRRIIADFGGLRVCAVDGEAIRNLLDVDFTMGGNAARYPYVPDGEIWVDESMSPLDTAATILHEALEYHDMRDRGHAYDPAHTFASEGEIALRHIARGAPPEPPDAAARVTSVGEVPPRSIAGGIPSGVRKG